MNINALKINDNKIKDQNFFFVMPLESCKEQSQLNTHLRRKDTYEILFVTKGYIIRESNLREIQINPKELHILLPGQITALHPLSDNINGFYCCFNSEFLGGSSTKDNLEDKLLYINSFMHRYPVRLAEGAFGRIFNCFDSLNKLYNDINIDYRLIRLYITTIIYEVKKVLLESAIDPYPSKAFKIAKQYHDLLIKHIGKYQDIKFYANLLNITANHLNKSIKLTTGKTANTVLNEIRILEAKVQLEYSDTPIGDIAFKLGFNDSSYFAKCFKKSTGLTPFEYRNTQ